MSVPKIDKHKLWKKKQRNKKDGNKCETQFPDCPPELDLKDERCKKCPFTRKMRK